jgi:hypothetical protein
MSVSPSLATRDPSVAVDDIKNLIILFALLIIIAVLFFGIGFLVMSLTRPRIRPARQTPVPGMALGQPLETMTEFRCGWCGSSKPPDSLPIGKDRQYIEPCRDCGHQMTPIGDRPSAPNFMITPIVCLLTTPRLVSSRNAGRGRPRGWNDGCDECRDLLPGNHRCYPNLPSSGLGRDNREASSV